MPRRRLAHAPAVPPAPRRRAERGASLIELVMVLLVLGLLATMALPRFTLATETSRVDAATAVLRSIWLAQRLHWIEHHGFAADLETLADARLIESAVADGSVPFIYAITASGATSFTAEAVRGGSNHWSGTLSIDEGGVLSGSLTNGVSSVSPIPD